MSGEIYEALTGPSALAKPDAAQAGFQFRSPRSQAHVEIGEFAMSGEPHSDNLLNSEQLRVARAIAYGLFSHGLSGERTSPCTRYGAGTQ